MVIIVSSRSSVYLVEMLYAQFFYSFLFVQRAYVIQYLASALML